PAELFAGIRAVAKGEPALAPSVAATLMRRAASPEPRMTEREVEVLELLADGQGNREMAKALFVSEATVKSHLSHIYTKLGVDTRAGAVAAAIEQRIIRR
ncbi:MAG TPA: response regulator transcription factor, partial [Microbacterium sp.]|nr:response regulator transcription factor [Microbacterium sp.]